MWFGEGREPLIGAFQLADRRNHPLSAANASDLLP
jgi:hypothetical protein